MFYAVFRINIQNEKKSYDLLDIYSDLDLAHAYIKKRLQSKLDHGFKRDPLLTNENYFTIVAKRDSFETKCPPF